jgi:hypothetical protein
VAFATAKNKARELEIVQILGIKVAQAVVNFVKQIIET